MTDRAAVRRTPARSPWRLAAAFLGIMGLVIAACSSDDEASAPVDEANDDEISAPVADVDEPDPTTEPGPAPDAQDDAGDAQEDDATNDEESETDPAGPSRLVIHHVGDVSLDARDIPVLARDDLAGPWDGVRDTFAEADLVLVNLECAATDGGTPQDKQFVFRCSLDALPHMRDAGVDVANLANNHTGDYGMQGMLDSVDNVWAAGMAPVGVGRDEDEAYTPHVVEVAGWRVAILGFGGVVPVPEWTARGDQPGQATGYDAARMAQAVEAAKQDADVVVVTVHWGAEGAYEPRPEDVVKAEAVIAAGADVVFGHHAHRLQPLEVVDGAPVFWNLGNFVWPRRSLEAATTAVAEYVLEPGGTVTSCLIPFEIDHDGVPRPTDGSRDCAEPTELR